MSTQAFVYRIYGTERELLYVGMTENDPALRVSDHRSGKPWGSRIRRFTVEAFDRRSDASQEERRAIAMEEPEFNVQWSAGREVHPFRRLREDRFMSASELARALGCTERSITLYESGRGAPRLGMAFRIAEIFDVSIDDVAACFRSGPVSA